MANDQQYSHMVCILIATALPANAMDMFMKWQLECKHNSSSCLCSSWCCMSYCYPWCIVWNSSWTAQHAASVRYIVMLQWAVRFLFVMGTTAALQSVQPWAKIGCDRAAVAIVESGNHYCNNGNSHNRSIPELATPIPVSPPTVNKKVESTAKLQGSFNSKQPPHVVAIHSNHEFQ